MKEHEVRGVYPNLASRLHLPKSEGLELLGFNFGFVSIAAGEEWQMDTSSVLFSP